MKSVEVEWEVWAKSPSDSTENYLLATREAEGSAREVIGIILGQRRDDRDWPLVLVKRRCVREVVEETAP